MMRDMTAADVDAVLLIEQAVQAYPWTRGNFTDAIHSAYICRVDEVEGELCSYAILMPAVDEAELLTIGVAAKLLRNGLGRMMLQEMLEIAQVKNMRRVFLEVRSSNAAAVALYLSAGFELIGTRRGYYRSANGNEDALTMARELQQHSRFQFAGVAAGERADG